MRLSLLIKYLFHIVSEGNRTEIIMEIPPLESAHFRDPHTEILGGS